MINRHEYRNIPCMTQYTMIKLMFGVAGVYVVSVVSIVYVVAVVDLISY